MLRKASSVKHSQGKGLGVRGAERDAFYVGAVVVPLSIFSGEPAQEVHVCDQGVQRAISLSFILMDVGYQIVDASTFIGSDER